MDQIQALIDILKDTPEMALWGIGIFLSWKLLTMGSIVGSIAYVAKLFINRYFDNKESHIVKAAELEIESKQLDIKAKQMDELLSMFDSNCINSVVKGNLSKMLNGMKRQSEYIHVSDVERVIRLISEDNRNTNEQIINK
jgi:hypothetical protein